MEPLTALSGRIVPRQHDGELPGLSNQDTIRGPDVAIFDEITFLRDLGGEFDQQEIINLDGFKRYGR